MLQVLNCPLCPSSAYKSTAKQRSNANINSCNDRRSCSCKCNHLHFNKIEGNHKIISTIFRPIVCNNWLCINEYKHGKTSTNDGFGFHGCSLLLGVGSCGNVTVSNSVFCSIHDNNNTFTWKCCFILSSDDDFVYNCLDSFGLVDFHHCFNVLQVSKRTLSNDSKKDQKKFRMSTWQRLFWHAYSQCGDSRN
ncbi:hypothetical protein QL285_085053 [Trifolium repens]|nr:hypothetical protein QL285_085053 [Trifolium repens]